MRKIRGITINIPKLKVFSKESLCKIKKKAMLIKKPVSKRSIRKPSEVSLRKYSLPGDSCFQEDPFVEDDLLVSYKIYLKKVEQNRHKRHLGIKVQEKYKIINTDLRNRLHVEDPPDDVKAITDIDETYFRYLTSHSRFHYISLYKSLKFSFNKRLRMRQETGYLLNGVLQIELDNKRELLEYERCVKRYKEQVKQFDIFLREDYQKAIEHLRESDKIVAEVNAKKIELECLANKLFTTRSKLLMLYFTYCKLQKYGRFLYYLSPPSWRAKHRDFAHSVEIEAKGFDLGSSSEEDTFNVIFERMQNECASGLVKPVLYFSHGNDLISIVESVEQQQFYHLAHVTQIAPETRMLKKMMNQLTNTMKQESSIVAHIIDDIEKRLNFDAENGAQLETQFMKILNGVFYDTIASADVLKLLINLDWCYETIFIEKSSNNIIITAKALEKTYMEYSYKLEAVGNEGIMAALKQSIKEEKEKTKKADKAARELRQFDSLKKSLIRAHSIKDTVEETVKISTKKRLSNRTTKCDLPKLRKSSQREITDAEIEYLCLFTDWTEKENPADYLQGF